MKAVFLRNVEDSACVKEGNELHPDTLDALDCIDAAMFTGDPYASRADYETLRAYVERWSRRLQEPYDAFLISLEEFEKEG